MKIELNLIHEIPSDIQEMAHKIDTRMQMLGFREWELMGIADRKLVRKLQAENEKLKQQLNEIRKIVNPNESY